MTTQTTTLPSLGGSRTFYKNVGLNGRDFWTGEIDFTKALVTGEIVRHPTSTAIDLSRHDTFFSVSSDINNNFGFGNYRLFRVEAVGEVVQTPIGFIRVWYAVLAFRITAELEARPGLERRPLLREPVGFLAHLDFLGGKEIHALANGYRLLGRPATPDLAPEVSKGARKWHCLFYREKVARAIFRAWDPDAWPMGDDLGDATTAAQRVVTALLYLDLLSLEKISDLLAPWCVAFGDGYINWQGILEHRNGKRRR